MAAINRMHHGNAHGVHVVSRGANRFGKDKLGWKCPFRNLILRHGRVHCAHNRCSANRISSFAKTKCIPNDAAMFGGNAAKRSDGAWEVVRLALDRNHPILIELDPSSIILKRSHHQRMRDASGGLGELLQQPQALPSRVITMVAPALRQYLDFRVGMGPSDAKLVGRINCICERGAYHERAAERAWSSSSVSSARETVVTGSGSPAGRKVVTSSLGSRIRSTTLLKRKRSAILSASCRVTPQNW